MEAANGCDSIVTVQIMIDPTSTHYISSLGDIMLSPNPARIQSQLQFELKETTGLRISISNVLGQEVRVIQTMDFLQQGWQQIPIPVADLNPGTYYIIFQSEHGRVARKLIRMQ